MQVLKFGGTSVASSEAMLRVIDIVRKSLEADRTIVVSSAVSGCTDALIETGCRAARKDESYKTLIAELRERHHNKNKKVFICFVLSSLIRIFAQ